MKPRCEYCGQELDSDAIKFAFKQLQKRQRELERKYRGK